MELHEETKKWLNTATKNIRFGPDWRAVEAELREHIEDKTDDMARIFRVEGEEAEAEALKRMGDPAEIGKRLAKLHRPWLGYLWWASRALLWGMIGVVILCLCIQLGRQVGSVEAALSRADAYLEPAGLEPERAELGGYTFRIVEAKTEFGIPYVTLRVSQPWYREPVDGEGVLRCLEMVLDDGTRVSIPSPRREELSYGVAYGASSLEEDDVVWGSVRQPDPAEAVDMEAWLARQGFFWQDITVRLRQGVRCEPGERVALDLNFPLGQVRLSAVLGEEAEP